MRPWLIQLRPPPDGTRYRSLWLAEALAAREGASTRLEGVERADVAVVGGGYAGLWTAMELRRRDPSIRVILLEGDICGAGASGRNGGFVMSWWSKFGSLLKLCGEGEARWLAATSASVIDEIGAFCAGRGADVSYQKKGWAWAATNPAQLGAWARTIEAAQSTGVHPFEPLSHDEISAMTGSSTHLAGVYERSAATLHPGRLARLLRAAATDAGVSVREHSPVTTIRSASPGLRLSTPNGEVHAQTAVLAINAWAAQLQPARRSLIVVASDVVATDPMPERLDAAGWPTGLAISDSRRLVNYYHRTASDRVIFGRGGGKLAPGGRVGDRFEGPSQRTAEIAGQLVRTYPKLADAAVATSWSGSVDYSVDGLPFFFRLPDCPEVIVGTGFSGNGVGPTVLAGRVLAALALRADDRWAANGLVRLPPARLPPEPFRYLGGLAVRTAITRKETAEDKRRRPGRLAAWLASLDPTGFVDRG
jgi:glycine/D-amino acid oxidase-like deaminating enzyme